MFKFTSLFPIIIRKMQPASHSFLFMVILLSSLSTFAQTSLPISNILDGDGTIKPNMSGSFDPGGFRFTYGPKGEPRFIAAEQSNQGNCSDSWDSTFNINGASDSIRAVVSDGAGNVYVGGAFRLLNSIFANGIAKWNGTSWSALGSGVDGRVDAIAMSGGDVYIAGSFTSAGGAPANNVAKWNGSSWSALGPGIGGGVGQGVLAIAVSGTNVYVGGDFNSNGGFPSFVAQWNGTSWTSMGTGMNNSVYALAVSGGNVYAGGSFTTAGGTAATGIAKWDGAAWAPLGSGVSNRVRAITVAGSDVYVGGVFNTAGGNPAASVAKWNGSVWSALGTGIGTGEVRAMTVSGSDVYVGGTFTTAGGLTTNRIAKWNGSAWSQMGTGMDGPPINGTVIVYGIAVSGGSVLAGGEFGSADGVYARKIAKWSSNSWSAFDGNAIDFTVRSVAVSGTDVYVGGAFNFAGSVPVSNVAKWNGSTWSAMGSGIPSNGFVNVVAVSGSNVYVGGNFSTAGGQSASNIARWNGTSWSQLGSGVNGSVFAITVVNSDLYVGGSFTTAGGNPANNIAKWNGSSWTGLNSGIVNIVVTIVPSGDVLYVGASTTTVDSPNYFLKYDGTTWTPLGQGMTGGGVSSIAVSGSDVYVAGGFFAVGGVSAPRIAKYNGTSWSALGAGLPGNTNNVKLKTVGSDLYAVGDFTVANGGPADRAAKWNGSSWVPLGLGLGGTAGSSAFAIAATGDSVWVGGFFTTAGCNISPHFARWRQTLWNGSAGTDWHTAANWGNGAVPTSNEGVTIQTSNASILTADVTASSLIVTGGRTLTIGAGRTLTITGDLYLGNGNLAGPGALVVNGDLTLNGADVAGLGSIVVNGNLTLNGGNISGPGPVSITACRTDALLGGSSSSFVSGPLTRCVNSSGTYRFPVGTAPVYSPVELANIVGSSNFTVDPKSGAYSGAANGLPANRLLRWWNLTNGGITRADVSFNYTDPDIVGTERRYQAWRIIGGTATRMPSALNQTTNRATVFGVSTFSPWTLAESEPVLATLSGRVTSLRGRGAESVVVTLTDGQGNIRYGFTNPFGYYRFTNVSTFQIYTVRVTSKKFTFPIPERMVDFDEFSGDVNFMSSDN